MNRDRQLTLQEHQRAVRLYNEMAVVFTETASDAPVLARNRWVEITITECLEEIGDERVLLEAWRMWSKSRNLVGLQWHVTKFQTEMAGLIPTAKREVDCQIAQAKAEAARRARLQGGAR